MAEGERSSTNTSAEVSTEMVRRNPISEMDELLHQDS